MLTLSATFTYDAAMTLTDKNGDPMVVGAEYEGAGGARYWYVGPSRHYEDRGVVEAGNSVWTFPTIYLTPVPKTVMVELTEADAEWFVRNWGFTAGAGEYTHLAAACRAALAERGKG